ncbi:MAG: Npt1/Npt2 family nucleotide transporter [Gemmatimonadota bacterium]|nr:Npt1/Npt2 family nucleotide transporter [Gemmatimonadota bacterium]
MFSRVSRTLGICDGEWGRLISMSTLVFLLLVGWAFGRSSRDAIFIKEAGPDHLPYVYIIGSLIVMASAPFYSMVVGRIARHRFMIGQLIGSAILLVAMRMAISLDLSAMPYLLFSITDLVIIVLFYMHFWMFANDVFDPREGKRLFPLIGGAGLAGSILGGLTVKPIVHIIGTANLLLVWAALLLIAIPTVIFANRAVSALGVASSATESMEEESAVSGIFKTISSVWEVPLIRILTYMAVPMWLAIGIVDYLFFSAMNEVFHDQDQLTGFLGLFSSVSSISSLILQLFVTGWLLKKLGVGSSVLIHPVSFSFGAIVLTIRNLLPAVGVPAFWSFRSLSAVFAKFSDNAPYYSVGESSTQLLFNALSEEKRGQGRAFISGTVEPVVTVLAGLVLLLFIALEMPLWMISLVTVGLAVAWILAASRIKGLYLQALVKNLSSRDANLSGDSLVALGSFKGPEVAPMLFEAVTSPDENVAVFALELLQNSNDKELIGRIHLQLPEARPQVKIAILNIMEEYDIQQGTDVVAPLLDTEDVGVCSAAIRVLGRLNPGKYAAKIMPFLNAADMELRAQAVIALMRCRPASDGYERASISLERTIEASDLDTREEAAYLVGEMREGQYMERLFEFLRDDSESVQRRAIEALVKIADPRCVHELIPLMRVDALAQDVMDAVIVLTDKSLEPLHRTLQALVNDDRQQHGDPGIVEYMNRIIFCLGEIGRPESADFLTELFEPAPKAVHPAIIDAMVRIKLTQAKSSETSSEPDALASSQMMHHVSNLLNHHRSSIQQEEGRIRSIRGIDREQATFLLIDALRQSSDYHEVRGLKCLQILNEPGMIRAAGSNLRRSEPRSKAEAIEVLSESGQDGRHFARILETKYFPEPKSIEDRETSEVLKQSIGSEEEVWLRACSIYAAGELQAKDLSEDLKALVEDPDPYINRHAQLALVKLDVAAMDEEFRNEVEKMGQDMERILFLKSVPLFAEMDGDAIRWVNNIVTESVYAKDETVFEEDAPGDAFYLIRRGSVRVVKGKENPVVISIREERDYIGEMAILDDEPRSATVEAQEDTEMLVINRDDFHRLVVTHPTVVFSLFKCLSRRLRETSDQLLETRQ